ncbi:MAG TPA: heat-shock protein HspR [Actinobacteria bacterium]|nr:heat-shock protein HspR [Actinomycetota bacterium]HCK78662.1 heat-shock protein HspR [Actinomycetota bacterium]
MSNRPMPGFDPHDLTPVFVISVAANLSGLHPQTLRQYDRLGLVSPQRTPGGRRYSMHDVSLLLRVQELAQTGLNLEGIRRVMVLEEEVERLRLLVEAMRSDLEQQQARRRELVPLPQGGALVVWRSQPRGDS